MGSCSHVLTSRLSAHDCPDRAASVGCFFRGFESRAEKRRGEESRAESGPRSVSRPGGAPPPPPLSSPLARMYVKEVLVDGGDLWRMRGNSSCTTSNATPRPR